MFSHILFGVYLGLFMWAGLWLRSPGVRALLPLGWAPNRNPTDYPRLGAVRPGVLRA